MWPEKRQSHGAGNRGHFSPAANEETAALQRARPREQGSSEQGAGSAGLNRNFQLAAPFCFAASSLTRAAFPTLFSNEARHYVHGVLPFALLLSRPSLASEARLNVSLGHRFRDAHWMTARWDGMRASSLARRGRFRF